MLLVPEGLRGAGEQRSALASQHNLTERLKVFTDMYRFKYLRSEVQTTVNGKLEFGGLQASLPLTTL